MSWNEISAFFDSDRCLNTHLISVMLFRFCSASPKLYFSAWRKVTDYKSSSVGI